MRVCSLVILVLGSIVLANCASFIESPQVTNFGLWGPLENCSEGFLVTGFQLKIEAYRRRLDNTAVNGIKFFCGNHFFKSVEEISSTQGDFGEFEYPHYCTTYATGFQLLSQSYIGTNKDDVAAANLRIICANDEVIDGFVEPTGHIYPRSNYTAAQNCPKGQAICGIQTQVEPFQGLADDTSLNNLRAKCCDVPFFPSDIELTSVAPQTPAETSTTVEASVADQETLSTSTERTFETTWTTSHSPTAETVPS